MLRFLKKQWFLLGMIGAVLLATAFPQIGKSDGPLRANDLANIGVSLVFFFHGMTLSVENLKNGLLSWKVHAAVQAMTFIAFPLMMFGFCWFAGTFLPAGLILGFYFLGALPSTISSSVAMVAIGRGNVSAAIFNASFSNLIGIFLTPLLVNIFAETTGETLPLGETILNLFALLFLPFLLGQVARIFFKKYVPTIKPFINIFDSLVILLIVFSSFADAVAQGLWHEHGWTILFETFIGASIILAFALAISWCLAKVLRFNKEDEITTVFCGSKKTLASGIPIAKIVFGSAALAGDINLGLLVLPIMFYHQLQIFVCSILANRYAKRSQ